MQLSKDITIIFEDNIEYGASRLIEFLKLIGFEILDDGINRYDGKAIVKYSKSFSGLK